MMTKLTTVPAKAGTLCVDGIDVDKLLRDIGEASASSNAVDLFDLLLVAQRVLGAVKASGAPRTPAEAQLLAAYRATDDDGQIDTLAAVEAVARVCPRRRPVLALVPPGGA
jgi:hypothetical protein